MSGWKSLRLKVCRRVASGEGRWDNLDGDASEFEAIMASIDRILISKPEERWTQRQYADHMDELER
jgi:hypothetical protein